MSAKPTYLRADYWNVSRTARIFSSPPLKSRAQVLAHFAECIYGGRLALNEARKVKDFILASNFLDGEESLMVNKAAKIALLILIPLSALAAPKARETVRLQVVTSKTRIHSSFANHVFAYTDLLFTQINGKKVVYECVQRGNICPMLESGKTYTADRDGSVIHISMNTPEDKKAIFVKFKQVGVW